MIFFKIYCCNDIVTVFTCYECHEVRVKAKIISEPTYFQTILMGARAGRVPDPMAKPWWYLTPEVAPLFSGQHGDCCTGMDLSEKLLYTAMA